MAKILIGLSSNVETDDSTTLYEPFGDTHAVGRNTTEAAAEITCRNAGDMTNLEVLIQTNTRSTSCTETLRVNGADSTLSISIGSGVTGSIVDTSTVALSASDTYCIARTMGSGGGSLLIDYTIAEFTPSSGSAKQIASSGDPSTSQSNTRYMPLCGELNMDSSEGDEEMVAPVAMTASNFQMYCAINTGDATKTGVFRINGADGNQSVSFGSGVTGLMEDTTNSDSLSAGDAFSVQWGAVAGTGSHTITMTGVKLVSDGSGFPLFAAGAQGAYSSGITEYSKIIGDSDDAGTESDTDLLIPFDMTAEDLSIHIQSNASTVTSTVRTHINGSNGNMSIAIGSGVTGELQDTSNTDSLSTDDLVNYSVSGQNGTVLISCFAMFCTEDAGGGGTILPQMMHHYYEGHA